MSSDNIFGKKSIPKLVLSIAIPSMLAQFVSVLYSIVDRMFVGNIPEVGDLSLAGVGVCGPVLTTIGAFAFWVGIGGTPLMGISLGEGKRDKAKDILGNCFALMCGISVVVATVSLLLKDPMLHLFGASDATYPYAEKYFTVYVSGTVFALVSVGMNQFIIAQGYAKTGMVSVIIGAVMNIILDPLFIFTFDMGVRGAALATVISQAVSAIFVLVFLIKKADIKISFGHYSIKTMFKVFKLGFTPYAIIAFDNIMVITMNAMLKLYGGAQSDALITCNTIVQSFMLILTMPLGGISGGTQGIISYNYGNGNTERILKAQRYIFALCTAYTTALFIFARVGDSAFVSLFTSDPELAAQACKAIRISTLAAIPLGIQYAIVDGFTAMGIIKLSFPLSFGRKFFYFAAVIGIPMFIDASLVFFSEPISDIFGPIITVTTYFIVIKKVLRKRELLVKSMNDNK